MIVTIPLIKDRMKKIIKRVTVISFPKKFIPGLNMFSIQKVINIKERIITICGSMLIATFKIFFIISPSLWFIHQYTQCRQYLFRRLQAYSL